MEEVVVIAAIALLVAFGVPAVRTLFKSLTSRGGGTSMISAALSSARAVAASRQRYAGVRFQHACYKEDPLKSPLKAPQYMIFIVHDCQNTTLANGFRAVEGMQPIKLPDDLGVMEVVEGDDEINTDNELIGKTTFSIIFSPSGKLMIHDVQTRNRNGEASGTGSEDDIFNTEEKITHPTEPRGMFLQDNSRETSKKSFRIYDSEIFGKIDAGRRYTDYLEDLETIYINPYTGTMIDR